MKPRVLSVSCSPSHEFSKRRTEAIRLLAGLGVAGDAHCGATVRHRSRVAADPSQPNLRQLHLIHAELFAELATAGFDVGPGDLGENVTTSGLDLLALPCGTLLRIGAEALVAITGLRNPCGQIERFRPGLLAAVLGRDAEGRVIRKAGVMAVVLQGGAIRPGDAIGVTLPPPPHARLDRV